MLTLIAFMFVGAGMSLCAGVSLFFYVEAVFLAAFARMAATPVTYRSEAVTRVYNTAPAPFGKVA